MCRRAGYLHILCDSMLFYRAETAYHCERAFRYRTSEVLCITGSTPRARTPNAMVNRRFLTYNTAMLLI